MLFISDRLKKAILSFTLLTFLMAPAALAQIHPQPRSPRKAPALSPEALPAFSDSSLKSFINDVFMTAQEVRPELRSAGLRSLAAQMTQMDVSRALWVYDQAFLAAQQVPLSSRQVMGDSPERKIILDESRLDLTQAINHTLSLQPPPPSDDPDLPPVNEKLILLSDLIRRIPPDETEGLFQKAASALVREDDSFMQTLAVAQISQKNAPGRSQQLFSEALSQFQVRPITEISFRSFIFLTQSLGNNNPALAETGIELLLKKADELDSQAGQQKGGISGMTSISGQSNGAHRLMVMNQLLPMMQKMNPSRANEWTALLRGKLGMQMADQPAPLISLNSTVDVTTGSSLVNRGATGNQVGSGPTYAQGQTQGQGRNSDNSQRPQASSPNTVGVAGMLGSGQSSNAQRPNMQRPQPPPDAASMQEMMAMGRQPSTAFSQQLNTAVVKAQTAARNDPREFSHLLETILPEVREQADPRARAAALAQISLSYFQLGDGAKAREYLKESILCSQEGDSPLLKSSLSPTTFFVMYCATSNVISRLAPQFPKEAIEAIRTIADAQLRFRVMIDNLVLLNLLSAVSSFKTS
jgi:hypothetical protein